MSRVRVAWSRCEGELEVAARERLGVVKIRSQVKTTAKLGLLNVCQGREAHDCPGSQTLNKAKPSPEITSRANSESGSLVLVEKGGNSSVKRKRWSLFGHRTVDVSTYELSLTNPPCLSLVCPAAEAVVCCH